MAQDLEHHRMMIWDLDPAVWRVRACEAAGRNLTRDEWTKFLPEGEPYHVTCPQYPGRVTSPAAPDLADCNADLAGSGCR